MRKVIYLEIADSLRRTINTGEYGEGRVLPSEASLGKLHGASRVTIRKALEVLRSEGLIESRQGFGWMVSAEPFPQSLDTLESIERQLANSGRTSEREIVDFKFITAPPEVAPILGPRVLEVRRLNTADEKPFARVTVWCREDLGLDLSQSQVARSSFHDLLPVGPKLATQTIGAALMSDDDAKLLQVPESSAALIVRRTTFADGDQPILMSEHCFPGHLTEFVAELSRPSAAESGTQSGLRLVGDS
ncbi:MAG: GntR family transcriptional regulator [Acidimicrobiales bacterium]